MTTGSTEFELKFTSPPADLGQLPESSFIAAVAGDRGGWERLTSTYFDTPDGDLAAQGLSLRLREEGADFIQAVKRNGASPAERVEYETAIESAEDFPAATGDTDIDRLIGDLKDAIVPIAGTSVDRWSAVVAFKDAEIEISIDLGRAECRKDDGSIAIGPLAELELELVSGRRKAVFDFARLLIVNAPLRLHASTKLETALSLKAGSATPPKAKRSLVSPDMTGADVLAGALCGAAVRMASLQSAVLDLRLPEGVHQMRVALRRLRAIERVFRRHLESDEISRLAMRAKIIASAMGPARDWDVFLGETLPSARRNDYAPDTMRALKARAEAVRARAWTQAAAVIARPDFTRFLIDLMEAGSEQKWKGSAGKTLFRPVGDFAPKALDRALRKAVKTAAQIGPGYDLSARHPLRIALKKLRYPVQVFRDLYPKDQRKAYMTALSELQEAFGAVNDAVVAQGLADEAAEGGGQGAMRAAGFISGYKAAEAMAAAKNIDAAWDAFEKMRPFWRD